MLFSLLVRCMCVYTHTHIWADATTTHCGACNQLPSLFNYISPLYRGELFISYKSFLLCCLSLFFAVLIFWQSKRLNWMLLSFETVNGISSSRKGDSASVFFSVAPIKADNRQMDWRDLKRLDASLSLLYCSLSCSAPIKCIMHSLSTAGAQTATALLSAPACSHWQEARARKQAACKRGWGRMAKVEKEGRVERVLEEPVHGSVPMIDLVAFCVLSPCTDLRNTIRMGRLSTLRLATWQCIITTYTQTKPDHVLGNYQGSTCLLSPLFFEKREKKIIHLWLSCPWVPQIAGLYIL